MNKIKRIKVNTKKGTRYLNFKPMNLENLEKPEGNLAAPCESVCPYGFKICSLLKNPTDYDNPDGSFLDFCSNLGEDDENNDLDKYCPCEGTIEENLSDLDDVFQNLIKKDPYIKVTDLIDHVCSDTCPLYNKEHTKCTQNNKLCLLQDILKNTNYGGE